MKRDEREAGPQVVVPRADSCQKHAKRRGRTMENHGSAFGFCGTEPGTPGTAPVPCPARPPTFPNLAAMSSSRTSRIFALLMLGSVMSGVFAPGAVALTREDIRAASERSDLASDVRDFFTKVLEDAMVRAALVGPVSAGAAPTLRRPGMDHPDVVVSPGTFESVHGPTATAAVKGYLPDGAASAFPSHRTGPLHPRAP